MIMNIKEEDKDLNYWKENCKEDYLHTPISVLRYITELEKAVNNGVLDDVINDFYCLEHDEETEKCKVQCPYCERI